MVSKGNTLNILSWNLNGLDEKNLDVRTELALQIMLLGAPIELIMTNHTPRTYTPPHVIALQEVTARSYKAHLKKHLQAAGYDIFPIEVPEKRIL